MEMSNNKQLTAVRWLVCQLQQTRDWQRVINEANQSATSVRNVLQQAKEMGEEQMIDFAYKALMEADSTVNRYVDVDELYNETYGGGNK
jgi:hypothetical protein